MGTVYNPNSPNKPTLTDVRNAGEYATTFRWSLTFTEPPRFWNNNDTLLKHMNVLCYSTTLPSKSVEDILIAVRGHKHYQPGRVVPNGSITLVNNETVNNQTHLFCTQWQESIWAHNTGVGLNYNDFVANTIRITLLDYTDNPILHYDLKWCFLENYTYPELSGSASGPFQTTITLSYNDFFILNPDGTRAIGDLNLYDTAVLVPSNAQ